MRGILRQAVSGISDVDPHGTIRGHSACIPTKGATRDEEQEEQCCEYSGSSVGARQSPTETGNPVEEGAERLRPSTEYFSERRQRCDVLRTMRDVWESAVTQSPDHGATESRDEAEQSHSACVHREATARDRTPLLSAWTREHDDAGHAVAESSLGMLHDQYYLRTQPGRVRCSTGGPGELRGRRREHGFHWGRRDTEPLKVQEQLKGVDQEACFQLIYESGQRPENQVAALGLVSRQKVESGEQVTESFNIPEGFFNCVVLDSQPTKSVPRRVRLAIERNIDEICPNRNPQSRLQHENLDVRSVGTTRPLRGVALFDETCDLTDEDAQEATVRACRSVNPGVIILGIPRTVSRSHLELCMTLCTWQHERGAFYIMILTDSEDAFSEEQYVALKTLQRNEGSAWLGRDLRPVGIGARLDSNLPALSRARVWTNSFTMAEHVQQEAIAREGPLHSEEFFHL